MAENSGRTSSKSARPSILRRVLRNVAIGIVGLYLLACFVLYFGQRHMLYPAPKNVQTPPIDAGRIIFVDQGSVILYRKPRENNPVLVYFHGNGNQLADLAFESSILSQSDLGFAAIEYPGYGLAKERGKPSEPAIFEAAERGIRHLIDNEGLKKEQIVLGGHSLGTGVAIAMAERGFGTRVLLLAPFTSIPDVAAESYPILPTRWFVKDPFDSLSRASSVHLPVLIVHGSQDELIPMTQGQTLASKLANARFLSVPAGRHHSSQFWGSPEIATQMVKFIRGSIGK